MRYEKGHKQATRQRIIETAAARFRRDGIEAVGVADLMAEAGLTHGGFYSHFKSKEDLIQAAAQEAATQSRARFFQRTSEGGLEAWIRGYLRTEHRDHPERGCPVPTLAAELARHPKSTRTGFAEILERFPEAIDPFLPALPPAAKRKMAFGIFGTLIGSMQMARAVTDPAMSDEILEAGIQSALRLAQAPTS